MADRSHRHPYRDPPQGCRPIGRIPLHGPIIESALEHAIDGYLDAGFGGIFLQFTQIDPEFTETIGKVLRRRRKRAAIFGIWLGPFHLNSGEEGAWVLALDRITLRDKNDAVSPEGSVACFADAYSLRPSQFPEVSTDANPDARPDSGRFVPLVSRVDGNLFPGLRVLRFRARRIPEPNPFDPAPISASLEALAQTRLRRQFGGAIQYLVVETAGLPRYRDELPWDPELPGLFRDTRGDSLIPRLTDLVESSDSSAQSRLSYRTLVAEMFRETLRTSTGDRAEELGLQWAAAFLSEPAGCAWPETSIGPPARFYAMQDFNVVSVSDLDYQSRKEGKDYSLRPVKEAASAMDQTGRAGPVAVTVSRSSGTYKLNGYRALIAQAALYGATQVVLEPDDGLDAAEDRPPAGPSQPYWPFTAKCWDAMARTHWLLRQGRRQCDTLVLDNASSIQTTHGVDPGAQYFAMNQIVSVLSRALLEAQIDFDYADESVLVARGHAEHRVLWVGDQPYRFVVIPPSLNLGAATFDLLHDFASGGGQVLAVGTAPSLLDGVPDRRLADFVETYCERVVDRADLWDYARLVERLVGLGARTVKLTRIAGGSVAGLRVHRRIWDDREIIHTLNSSEDEVRASLALEPRDGHVERWLPETGGMHRLASFEKGSPLELMLDWQPFEAMTLVLEPGEGLSTALGTRGTLRKRVPLDWTGRVLDPNAWTIAPDQPGGEPAQEIRLEYDARGPVPSEPAGFIAFGDAEPVSVRWNGTVIEDLDNESTVIMGTLTGLPLPPFQSGTNVLKVSFREAAQGEAARVHAPILFGPFRVRPGAQGRAELVFGEDTVGIGPWREAGLPHYAGKVAYSAEIETELAEGEQIAVSLEGLRGYAEVRCNGDVVDHVLWPPFECDLTRVWQPGTNQLEITVANATQNLAHAVRAAGESSAPGVDDCGLLESPELRIYTPAGSPPARGD